MADFNGEDLGDAASSALVQGTPDSIPSHTWDSLAPSGSTVITTGLELVAGLELVPGLELTE